MQAIIDFLSKRYVFILFLILEFVAATLLFQNSKYQRSTLVNTSNALFGSLYETVDDWRSYLNLKQENEYLRRELAELSLIEPDDSASRGIPLPLSKTDSNKTYSHYVAKVINSTVSFQNNFLTLDMGSKDGIRANMPVITSSGVVGIVKDVSPNYSTVISLLSVGVRFNAKLKRNNYSAAVLWDNSDSRHSKMIDLPGFVDITVGDTVVTNSYSALFPAEIPIGIVESYEQIPGENMYSVNLKLANDFRQLDYVLVLDVKDREEREQIESYSP